MEDNRKNVFKVYNKIADWYCENRYKGLLEKPYLDEVAKLSGPNATVLDLGCGAGLPIMGHLIELGLKVTGVDASFRMLELARRNFPEVELFQQDMRDLSFNKKFNAIIAWNSFFHLPPEDQPAMFTSFKNHLKSKGVLLFTSGKEYGKTWGENGGEKLYHGSLSTHEYRQLLTTSGFQIINYTEDDPNCGFATIWLAQLLDH